MLKVGDEVICMCGCKSKGIIVEISGSTAYVVNLKTGKGLGLFILTELKLTQSFENEKTIKKLMGIKDE